MKAKTQFIALIFALTFNSHLYGEDRFAIAHRIYAQFWNDALKAENPNSKTRQEISQRAAELPEALRTLLTDGILEYLNGPTQPSSDTLKRKLSDALTPPMLLHTAEGVADVLPSQLGDQFVVVYAVSYCAACSRTWLGEFARRDGRFFLRFSPKDTLPNQQVNLAPIHSNSAALTFLLYGVHLGDAHNRLNVQAFAADGTVHLLWSRLDLPQGQLSISNNRLTLTYLTSLVPPWKERSEDYIVDEHGPHLAAEAENSEP